MTYDLLVKDYYYIKNSQSKFTLGYSDDDYWKIISLCKRTFNKEFTNEVCVRLDDYYNNDCIIGLQISKAHFFDFLVSNFLLLNFDKLSAQATDEEKNIIGSFRNAVLSYGELSSFRSIIDNRFLSNNLAVSLIISDKNNVLITKRNGKVGISNNFLSTTVTGSVDESDFLSDDPLKNCCVRECKEELNCLLFPEQIVLKRIVCGHKKTQPIALLDAMVDSVFDVEDSIRSCKGFQEENSNYHIIEKKEIPNLLNDNCIMITEAGRAHLEGLTA